LIAALRELDDELSAPVDLVIVGGAAMILHFGAGRATRDVDVLAVQGDVDTFWRAVRSVAAARDLPEDWISDAAKGFGSVLPPDYRARLDRLDIGGDRLSLFVLGRPEQVALKIIALREQDLEDLDLLMPHLTSADIAVVVTIMEHVATFRPDWAQRIRYFMEERGWPM
jgi:predicted nucleotidyltransferase